MSGVPFQSFLADLRELGAGLAENLMVMRSAGSTNRSARRLLQVLPPKSYPPATLLIVAHEQTRGRGRLGRGWKSPAGHGLYCSRVTPLAARRAPATLPLAAAVALCEGLREAGVRDCQLKWPNDLVVGPFKLGGILIEVVAAKPDAVATAVIGFGINLLGSTQDFGEDGAVSVEEVIGRRLSAGELLGVLARHLRERLDQVEDSEALVEAYRSLLCHDDGDELSWSQGDETIRGRYAGLDESGRLLLDTASGRRVVSAGDIIEP